MTIADMDYDEEGRNYSLNKNVKNVEFRMVWFPIDRNGDLTQGWEGGYDALAVKRQGGWDIHNVTPQERVPGMARCQVKAFMERVAIILSEVLGGPIVRFPSQVVDWDMMEHNPYSEI